MANPNLSNVTGFEWDKGNIDKSYQKHGITTKEAEEIFLDINLKVQTDIKHSETEERFIGIYSVINSGEVFAKPEFVLQPMK